MASTANPIARQIAARRKAGNIADISSDFITTALATIR
jgi:hypothetical protein